MGSAGTSANAVSDEELAAADDKFCRAMALRSADPEQAVTLFGEVLQTRVQRYGPTAPECASAYYRYGAALFEQAISATDVLGEQLQLAASRHEDRGGDKAGNADDGQGEGEDDEEGEESEEEEQVERAGTGDGEGAPEAGPDKGKQPAAPPGGASADGGEDGEPGTPDDMGLAWEMLEAARVIYEAQPEAHTSVLADVHLYLGDIYCEQENFEGAAKEFKLCAEHLGALPGARPQRRLAEAHFKQAIALQYLDQPEAALQCVAAAQSELRSRISQLQHDIAAELAPAPTPAGLPAEPAAPGGGPPAAAHASGPASAQAAGGADRKEADEHAAREIEEVRLVMEDLTEKEEELRAIIAEHMSMKNALRSAMRVIAGAAGGDGLGSSGLSSDSAAEASSAGCAAPVQQLGVIGGGRRVTVAPTVPSAAHDPPARPSEPVSAAAPSGPKRTLEDAFGARSSCATTTIGFGSASNTPNVPAAPAATPAVKRMQVDAGAAQRAAAAVAQSPKLAQAPKITGSDENAQHATQP